MEPNTSRSLGRPSMVNYSSSTSSAPSLEQDSNNTTLFGGSSTTTTNANKMQEIMEELQHSREMLMLNQQAIEKGSTYFFKFVCGNHHLLCQDETFE